MVAFLPGESFGATPEQLTARLAFVDFDGSKALEALEQGISCDNSFLETYCQNVVAGDQSIKTSYLRFMNEIKRLVKALWAFNKWPHCVLQR